jgi:hypothetical protein
MISSQTASVGGSEVFPLKRTLLGQAGARTADAPSKKDLLAALGQNSEGDSVGAIEKASRAQAQVDGAEDGSAADSFASAVAPFLQTAPGVQRSAAAPVEGGDAMAEAGGINVAWDDNGDGQTSDAETFRHSHMGSGANTVSSNLSAGRMNSQMLSVLLQHQAA